MFGHGSMIEGSFTVLKLQNCLGAVVTRIVATSYEEINIYCSWNSSPEKLKSYFPDADVLV